MCYVSISAGSWLLVLWSEIYDVNYADVSRMQHSQPVIVLVIILILWLSSSGVAETVVDAFLWNFGDVMLWDKDQSIRFWGEIWEYVIEVC